MPNNQIESPSYTFIDGSYLALDSSSRLAYFSAGGTKQFTMDPATGNTVFYNGGVSFQGLAGGRSFTTYNNITTSGVGIVPIYGAGVQTLNTNVAPTTLSYTPPATAGVYRFSAYLDALTAGTMTFKVKITYKDPNGTARTDIPAFYLQNTTALLAGGPAANTAGQYVMFPYTLAIDNSATAITIQDNAGTYTAGTYYWTPILEQLA